MPERDHFGEMDRLILEGDPTSPDEPRGVLEMPRLPKAPRGTFAVCVFCYEPGGTMKRETLHGRRVWVHLNGCPGERRVKL